MLLSNSENHVYLKCFQMFVAFWPVLNRNQDFCKQATKSQTNYILNHCGWQFSILTPDWLLSFTNRKCYGVCLTTYKCILLIILFFFVRIGCKIVDEASWPDAPLDAFIVGIKELPDEDRPLQHRHIYFGHAYKVRNNSTLQNLGFQTVSHFWIQNFASSSPAT